MQLLRTVDRLQGEGFFPVEGKHLGHGDLAPLRKDFHLLLFIVRRVINQIHGEILAVVDLIKIIGNDLDGSGFSDCQFF